MAELTGPDLDAARATALAAVGLSPELAPRLRGTDHVGIRADARSLAEEASAYRARATGAASLAAARTAVEEQHDPLSAALRALYRESTVPPALAGVMLQRDRGVRPEEYAQDRP